MSFPLPYTAEHEAYTGTVEDALGNVIPAWAAPATVACFYWSPSSTEPAVAGHDRVVVDLVLVVDSALPVGSLDRVTVDGRLFEFIGYPEDYDHGPWWSPGRRPVNLRRVEG